MYGDPADEPDDVAADALAEANAAARARCRAFVERFLTAGESVTIRFDTDAGTAAVVMPDRP